MALTCTGERRCISLYAPHRFAVCGGDVCEARLRSPEAHCSVRANEHCVPFSHLSFVLITYLNRNENRRIQNEFKSLRLLLQRARLESVRETRNNKNKIRLMRMGSSWFMLFKCLFVYTHSCVRARLRIAHADRNRYRSYCLAVKW